ncbi:MAG: glycosyltransferase [Gammaproteobacteria bacterium]|nr:glycosyltransferase [Gammaproteobacteria bacterium]
MKVILFGRLPANGEVGGVTTFIYNLSLKYNEFVDTVVDFYPSNNDKIIPKGVNARLLSGNYIVRFIKLYLLNFKRNRIYHYNFSSVKGLLLLFVFPKQKQSKWIIMLHNGEQEKVYNSFNKLKKNVIRKVFDKADLIVSISEKQDKFYHSVTNSKLCRASPFIENNALPIKSLNKDKANLCFVIAGYPTYIYRHIETLNVFESLWRQGYRFKLFVCIYGLDHDGILDKIYSRVKELSFVEFYSHLDAENFQNILLHSDFYVRMNAVDSYGLVVAEALHLGLKVITTNVCKRYPGAYLVDVDDFYKLEEALKVCLSGGSLDGVLEMELDGSSSAVTFSHIYDSLKASVFQL